MLKGVWHEIFDFRFFSWIIVPPGPKVFHKGRFEFFRKFAEIFANECLSPVSTTPAISCSPVSTTPAINLSPVSLISEINFPPVSMTPAINLLPVTTTPVNKDRRKLKLTNRWYLRPPKSDTASDGVIRTAMKSCIHRHPIYFHQRPLRSPILNIAV